MGRNCDTRLTLHVCAVTTSSGNVGEAKIKGAKPFYTQMFRHIHSHATYCIL